MTRHPQKSDFPVSQVRRYLEPVPIVLVSSQWLFAAFRSGANKRSLLPSNCKLRVRQRQLPLRSLLL